MKRTTKHNKRTTQTAATAPQESPSIAPLNAAQFDAIVAQRIEFAMNEATKSAAHLVGEWANYFKAEQRQAAHLLTDADMTPQVRQTVERERAAWKHAERLFFAILPAHVESVAQTVAAEIEKEFPDFAGGEVAGKLRAADFETVTY